MNDVVNNTLVGLDGFQLPGSDFSYVLKQVLIVIVGLVILLALIYIYLNVLYFRKVERLLFIDQFFRRERSSSIYVLLHQANDEFKEKNKYKANIDGFLQPQGVVLGKTKSKYVCIPENKEFHLIISGGSGAGKTSKIIIPSLRAWNSSSLYIDISGDILINCASHKNKKTYVYTPFLDDLKSEKYKNCRKYMQFCLYDPLYRLRTFKSCFCSEFIDEVEKISSYIIPINEKLSDIEAYYRQQAKSILSASIVHFYKDGIESFPNICKAILINNLGSLISELKADTDDYIQLTMSAFEDNFSPQTLAGIKNSLASFIDIFAKRENIAASLRAPRKMKDGNYEKSITPELLDCVGRNICIYIPEAELKTLQPLFRLLVMQIFQYAFSKKSKTPVLLCLDELARLGHLPDFEDALRTLRKRKVRIMGALQSLTDLSIIYGTKEAEGILNNFNFKACLSATDTETQEYYAKLVGRRTHAKTSYSHGETNESFGDQEREDYIIEPSSLAYLPDANKVLALMPSGWAMLDGTPYYLERGKNGQKKSRNKKN